MNSRDKAAFSPCFVLFCFFCAWPLPTFSLEIDNKATRILEAALVILALGSVQWIFGGVAFPSGFSRKSPASNSSVQHISQALISPHRNLKFYLSVCYQAAKEFRMSAEKKSVWCELCFQESPRCCPVLAWALCLLSSSTGHLAACQDQGKWSRRLSG